MLENGTQNLSRWLTPSLGYFFPSLFDCYSRSICTQATFRITWNSASFAVPQIFSVFPSPSKNHFSHLFSSILNHAASAVLSLFPLFLNSIRLQLSTLVFCEAAFHSSPGGLISDWRRTGAPICSPFALSQDPVEWPAGQLRPAAFRSYITSVCPLASHVKFMLFLMGSSLDVICMYRCTSWRCTIISCVTADVLQSAAAHYSVFLLTVLTCSDFVLLLNRAS